MTDSTPIYPFRDPSLPFDDRVIDLISRLTIEEKVSQMNHLARAIPRLEIPAYNYWSEALHGVARNGRATIFPQAVGMAATWNRELVRSIASAIGDEARAKYHEVIRQKGSSNIYQGLTFWSPNVNLFRDPRWGRGQETWGEDPYLTGELGSSFVRGLQGDHPRYLKTAACAKHFAVHSGPEKERHSFNAVVTKQDLFSSYLPAFKKLVMEAEVEAVMGAYNRVLGEPCCASQFLLKKILRNEWGFHGHVVSDCGALSDIHKSHQVTGDAVESAALALKAGCDIDCDCVYESLQEALQRGLINEEDIDRALTRTLLTRFKLGMFDPPGLVPYSSIPMSVVDSDEHRRLARTAARQSIVLLKNHNQILPIKPQVNSIFVTGPGAAITDILLGNYHGLNGSMVTLIEGIVSRAPEGMKIEYRLGCQWTAPNAKAVNWAVYEAAESDLTIACLGTSPMMEGEEGESILSAISGDRVNIGLPDNQVGFIKELASQGAKIILVLSGGSPIALNGVEDLVEAVVMVWYPGEEGGNALAEILFGDYSPSGKLPLTFPCSLEQLPPFDDYSMSQRTYRYSSTAPLYPFGFGLGYAQFRFENFHIDKPVIESGDSLQATVTITNISNDSAEEVVQVYLSALNTSIPVPICSLIDFQRVDLLPLEQKSLSFIITSQMMSVIDIDGNQILLEGDYRLEIGSCSPGERGKQLGAPAPMWVTFTIA